MINSIKNIEYANAYSEIIEIFKYLDKNDYNKIPKNIIDMMSAYSNKDYIFTYDSTKNLNEQNISQKTKEILAAFFCEYWATDEQKNKIDLYDKKYYEEKELIAHEKYNPDNIFKNTSENIKEEPNSDVTLSLIEVPKKETLLAKIINYLKSIFFK